MVIGWIPAKASHLPVLWRSLNMKKHTLSLLSSILVSAAAQAGETVHTLTTVVQGPPSGGSLYNPHDWQIDLFGSHAFTDSENRGLIGEDEVFGGGLGVNYFITRNVGVGAEGNLIEIDGELLGSANLNVLLRFPIAETGLAPYIYGGAGLTFNGDDLDSDDFSDARDRLEDDEEPRNEDDVIFIAHAGAGLEYRFTSHFSVFGDVRYTWTESDNSDFGLGRVGFRFPF